MFNGNPGMSNGSTSPYVNLYSSTPTFHRGGHFSNSAPAYAAPSHQLPTFYGGFNEPGYAGHSYRRVQASAAVSGMMSSQQAFADPLNALQNLAARQGAGAPPQSVMNTQARPAAYQMQTNAGPVFASQGAVTIQQMGRPAPVNYEAARAPHDGFPRMASFQQPGYASFPGAGESGGRRAAEPRPPLLLAGGAPSPQEEALKERLRQMAACYLEPLKSHMAAFPDSRARMGPLCSLLANPTLETARSLNVKLSAETLHNMETLLRNQTGLRPGVEPQAGPAQPAGGQAGLGPGPAGPAGGPVTPSAQPEAEVKGPYSVGNELFFLLERLNANEEGRRKLAHARLAIHRQLQLDAVAGQPSHVSGRVKEARCCRQEGEELLSDTDQPADQEEEEAAPPAERLARCCEEAVAGRVSTDVWCEIRALPAPFRVRLNASPPAMASMESEESCLDAGEWNSSLHLLVRYEDEALPEPLPQLPVRLPGDYPSFRHISWLVDRDAYRLTDADDNHFLGLVGRSFVERSAKVRRAYAEQLSLYRVLLTWHHAVLEAYAKYSGLEELKKNPYF